MPIGGEVLYFHRKLANERAQLIVSVWKPEAGDRAAKHSQQLDLEQEDLLSAPGTAPGATDVATQSEGGGRRDGPPTGSSGKRSRGE